MLRPPGVIPAATLADRRARESLGIPADAAPAAERDCDAIGAVSACAVLGDAGMVELVSLCGYYTQVSFLLNAFTVPLPPDALPMWADS